MIKIAVFFSLLILGGCAPLSAPSHALAVAAMPTSWEDVKDGKGGVLKSVGRLDDGTLSREVYLDGDEVAHIVQYRNDGSMAWEEFYRNALLARRVVYDREKRVNGEDYFGPAGERVRTLRFEDGRLRSEISWNSDGRTYHARIYDDQGQLAEEVEGQNSRLTRKQYNGSRELLRVETVGETGVEKVVEYDGRGHVFRESSTNKAGPEAPYRRESSNGKARP